MKRDYFSIKFQGNIYNDAWKDGFGHIWFSENVFEYIPADGLLYLKSFVRIHGMVKTGISSFTHTSSEIDAEIEIL